jgi:hypothetical protein
VTTLAELRACSSSELADVLASGRRFDPTAVEGWIYRGVSLGMPRWIERLTWVKFAKAFHRDRDATGVRGWNIRIEQDGLDQPWRPQLRGGRAVMFGDFIVVDGADGITLDYRVDRTLRMLRDPLVALDDRADRLFGRSLLQLGPVAFATPSYFVLERDRPVVDPRRASGRVESSRAAADHVG